MKKTAYYLIIIVSLLAAACGKKQAGEIAAPGTVDGEIVTLKAQVPGTVEKIHYGEGDPVEKGKVLVEINAAKVENQLQELNITLQELAIERQKLRKKALLVKRNVKYLRTQAERFRRLQKSRSLAGEKVEQMELKLLEAETGAFEIGKTLESLAVKEQKIANKRAYLELVLGDHTVTAPTAGVVLEKFVSAGETVFPNTALVDILDTAGLYVEVFIEEPEMAALQLGQKARIGVDGLDTDVVTGVIDYFGRKAEFSPKYIISEKERKSLLYRVKIRIDKGREYLKLGMPVTVSFPTD